LVEFEGGIVDQRFEEDNNLDIFEMTTSKSEPTMKLINKELLIFKRYERMSKTSSAHFNGGKNMKTCFPQLVFMLKKILGIIGSQIETKRIFL
jgi:hypothetical protein